MDKAVARRNKENGCADVDFSSSFITNAYPRPFQSRKQLHPW